MLVRCGSDEQSTQTSNSSARTDQPIPFDVTNPEINSATRELMLNYLQQIESDYSTVEVTIKTLQTEIEGFIQQTDVITMDRARDAWLIAHSAYELTSLHRHFANLVLTQQDKLTLNQLQYQINHWPVLPGYIDYVDGYPDSGIVHDMNVVLELDSLREQHGFFDVSEASLGFHVIEYLLWGSNTNNDPLRPASDYLLTTQLSADQANNGFELDQLSNNRRRRFLAIAAQALLEDFQLLRTLWSENTLLFQRRVEGAESADYVSSRELLSVFAESITTVLKEDLLLRSLYPMLNGDFTDSMQSPFSHSTVNTVSSQLNGLERLLLENQTDTGTTLDSLFSSLSDDFSEFFYQNYDANKACLILLYGDLDRLSEAGEATKSEFEIVQCINLLTNMIEYVGQLESETL